MTRLWALVAAAKAGGASEPSAGQGQEEPVQISVVICAYAPQRWRDLVAAVDSLRLQTAGTPEIVVVIDYNEALLERAQEAFPEAKVLANRERQGLSGARNTGWQAVGGEIVAFLDDDAMAAPDWLEVVRETYRQGDVLGAGGKVIPIWEGGRRPRWLPPEFDWVVGCSYRGLPERTAAIRNLIGANMSYRRQALARAGGFQEGIGRIGTRPLGCEETELGIRVLNLHPGGRTIYEPAARVWHRVPRSRMGPRYFISRCYAEGLSKALVTDSVGTASGLSSEWSYTVRTLPRGVLAGLRDAVIKRDVAGLARAGAIVAGLATTTMGYLAGRAQVARRSTT